MGLGRLGEFVRQKRQSNPLALYGLAGVLVLAVGIGVVLALQDNQAKANEGDVVLTVNGEPITRDEFYAELESQAGQQVLDQLVTRRLVSQAAAQQGIEISDEQVQKEIDRIAGQFPSVAAYQAALAQYGLTEEALRRDIRVSLEVQALARLGVTVTDEEISKYFEENKEELGQPEQVRASHILVKDKAKAESLLKQLKEGADFAELAKENSEDAGTRDVGGDLGFFSRGQMVESFENAAFDLKVGELSDVVESPYGFHIIKVTDRKEAKPATLDEKREEIRETLFAQKSRPAQDVIESLRSAAQIDVKWERYSSFASSQAGTGTQGGASAPNGDAGAQPAPEPSGSSEAGEAQGQQ